MLLDQLAETEPVGQGGRQGEPCARGTSATRRSSWKAISSRSRDRGEASPCVFVASRVYVDAAHVLGTSAGALRAAVSRARGKLEGA